MPTVNDLSEIPQFKSHKVVHALQIKRRRNRTISFSDTRFEDYAAPHAMFARYEPVAGDYLVIYEDGYMSFSPKQAFEEGYSPLATASMAIEAGGSTMPLEVQTAAALAAAESHPDITRNQFLRLKATEYVLQMMEILNGNPARGDIMLWIDCTYDYLRTGKLQGDANGDTAEG